MGDYTNMRVRPFRGLAHLVMQRMVVHMYGGGGGWGWGWGCCEWFACTYQSAKSNEAQGHGSKPQESHKRHLFYKRFA